MVDQRTQAGRIAAPLGRWRRVVGTTAADLLARGPQVTPLERGWAGPVLGVWVAGRAVNLLFLFLAFQLSTWAGWTFGPDGERAAVFLDFLSGWDAERYGTIAAAGYPSTLPMDADGDIQLNNWAFLPVFPFLERAISDVSGLSWQIVGVGISMAASAAATVVLYVLLRHVAAPRASWWAVVLFSFAPLSFVFVVGYAESLFLFIVFSALLLAVRRKYLLIAPLGVLAAFTRPGALALALALGILLIARLAARSRDPISRSETIGLVVSGLATAASGLAWPVIADAVTGTPGAYVRTEMAWWAPFLGDGPLIPLTPSLVMGWTWLGVAGVVIVIAVVVAAFRWILSPPVRMLGIEIVGFALSYTLYLFAVFLPTQSVARLVLPLAPLLADSRLSQSRRRRSWSLALSIVLQALAVFGLWTIVNP